MQGERHDIDHEFPEYHARLESLRQSDSEFDATVKEHDELDTQIRRLEERQAPIADAELEKLKFRRAHLKDQIYQALRLQAAK